MLAGPMSRLDDIGRQSRRSGFPSQLFSMLLVFPNASGNIEVRGPVTYMPLDGAFQGQSISGMPIGEQYIDERGVIRARLRCSFVSRNGKDTLGPGFWRSSDGTRSAMVEQTAVKGAERHLQLTVEAGRLQSARRTLFELLSGGLQLDVVFKL